MIIHRWGYFLNHQQLVDIFKARGGKVGTFNPQNPDDVHHARRAIFTYLQPGSVLVWNATLDQQAGVMFFVGKPVQDPRESLDRGLAMRCKDTFERPPNHCRVLNDGSGLNWVLAAQDGSIHRLCLTELLQCDREGDRHPLKPEVVALLASQPTTFTLLPPVQPRISLPKVYHRWGYFLEMQQIVNIFKSRGGTLGTVDPQSLGAMHHARRAIYCYLQPGCVQVWLAWLGEEVGIVFFIGKPVPNIRESVDEELKGRCMDMFERLPDPCRIVKGSSAMKWDLTDRDGSTHRLRLAELLQSNSQGDAYPISEDKIAVLHAPTSPIST